MRYNVIGTIYYNAGFDLWIEAPTRDEAEDIVKKHLQAYHERHRGGATYTAPSLHEICIETVQTAEEDT
jgi:hypothetical protein